MTPSFKSLHKGITMIYFALIMMQILFALVVYYLIYSGQLVAELDKESAQTLKYVLYVLCPLGVVAGHMIYRQNIGAIDATQPMQARFNKLQVAVLIRSACLEVPSLLGAVAAMLTGDPYYLLFTAIMVALFFVWRPTQASVAEELQLSPSEREAIEN